MFSLNGTIQMDLKLVIMLMLNTQQMVLIGMRYQKYQNMMLMIMDGLLNR